MALICFVNGEKYHPTDLVAASSILRITGHSRLANTLLFSAVHLDSQDQSEENCTIDEEMWETIFGSEKETDGLPGFDSEDEMKVGTKKKQHVEIDVIVSDNEGEHHES